MLQDIRDTRIEKLKQIAKPYPGKVSLPYRGRIRSIRKHGKITFANIDNQQILLKDKYPIDIGDIVEYDGKKIKTKSGEPTIEINKFNILAKSLRPLPEQWYGLKDKEIRFRKRYLDLLMNKEVRNIFEKRSEIIKKLRTFLDKNNFIEVETPILQPLYGGASAQPFKTHLNALKMDLYLRIAPELYLKRLLVGGLERVYEIGRCFRNEGMDREHNPDFTMLEWYAAYWDWNDLMDFTEELMAQFGIPKKWDRIEYPKNLKNEKEFYKKLKRPTFVLHLPNIPLAKKGQALQGVIEGQEIIKAFTEQNDPLEQRKALKKDKDQPVDEDFLEALEYGMPPAAGFGMGIDRLVKLLTGAKTLREVILFPTMKPK